MTDPIHVVILVGAYVLGLVMLAGGIVSSVINYRFSKRVEARKDLTVRVSRLEAESTDVRDLVDRLSKRWTKRFRDEQSSAPKNTDDGSEPEASNHAVSDDRDGLVAEWLSSKRF